MKYAALILLLFPIVTSAQYTPIVGIPGVSGGTIDEYMNALYVLSITIAALLAVIKIVIAGVKWMTTDIVTSKGEAKKDIQGALLGLLIILSVVLIIEVINPDIGTVDLTFDDASAITTPPPPSSNLTESGCISAADCAIFTCATDDCTTEIDRCSTIGGSGNVVSASRLACTISNPTIVTYATTCGLDGSSCENVNCAFWRLTSCSTWCQDNGGVFHQSGNIFTSVISGNYDSCSMPTGSATVTYYPCARVSTADGPSWDCDAARNLCTENGTNSNQANETPVDNLMSGDSTSIACVTP